MLHPKSKNSESGFTLIEMLITMTVASIVALAAYQFFTTSLTQYFDLEQNSMASGELAQNSQRIATVLRGATNIVSANADDITVYAYFSPDDTYVSLVKYYLNANSTVLMADITPMTANPPIGTPITAQKRTYTIISNYLKVSGLDLFKYLDTAGTAMTQPISDLNAVKGIQINLAVPISHPISTGNQQLTLQVTLRNKKTNL